MTLTQIVVAFLIGYGLILIGALWLESKATHRMWGDDETR